jgi:hypothetical protein
MLFILFVLLGGFLSLINKRWVFVHLPAAIWGAIVEFKGFLCPLTPLENWLRKKGGYSVYEGDFIENYLLPILYPSTLTKKVQIALGSLVIAINLCAYLLVFVKSKRGK